MANESELQDQIEALTLQMADQWTAMRLAFQVVAAILTASNPDLRGSMADMIEHQMKEAAAYPHVAGALGSLRDALRGSAPAPAGPTRAH